MSSKAVTGSFCSRSRTCRPTLFSTTERHYLGYGACQSYKAANFGLKLGLGDLKVNTRDDLFERGDKSRFGLLEDDEGPLGNVFAMCDGKVMFMTLLVGTYFDDGDMWAEFVAPTLDAIDRVK